MPVNIGNEGMRCVSELRGNPDFARLLDVMAIVSRDLVYASLRSPVDQRVQQTAWAEGIREFVEALHMAYEGKTAGQLGKTEPPQSPKFRTRE